MSSENKFLDLCKYEILYSIGSGAFSNVFLVKDKATNINYAAKISKFIIDEETEDQKETLALFREVNLISLLNHPSILKFIGYSQVDFDNQPTPTIVTEYVSNGTLRDIINNEKLGLAADDWSPTKKLIIIYGIACGMSYMHANKIIHRDLKPENILIDDNTHPKIADFGLSKINDILEISINIQSASGYKGTPMYMAPEIFQVEQYTNKTDVYTFAFILFELVTLQTPYTNFGMAKIIRSVSEGIRPSFPEDISDAYRNLIERCWAQDPNSRPSFDEIVEDLKSNKEYIDEMIDEVEFDDYIEYINEYKNQDIDFSQRMHFKDFIQIKHFKMEEDLLSKKIKDEFLKDIENNNNNLQESNKTNNNSCNDEENEANDELLKGETEENLNRIKETKVKDSNKEAKVELLIEETLLKIKEMDDDSSNTKETIDELYKEESENTSIKDKEKIIEANAKNPVFEAGHDEYQFIYPIEMYERLDEGCKNLIAEAQADPIKQFEIAKSLITGSNNFPINNQIAMKYLIESSKGYLDSTIYYIEILIKGEIIPQDLQKAKEIIIDNKNNKDPRFFTLLGKIFKKTKKYSDALNYFEKGMNHHNDESIYEYAKMEFLGQGCAKNDKKAINLFNKSATCGHFKSKCFLYIFDQMNKNKDFKKLAPATQYFIIKNFINKNKNNESDKFTINFDQIKIKPYKTEMLMVNNSLRSTFFYSFLSKFESILFELPYKSELFQKILKIIVKLKEKKINHIKIGVVFDGLTQHFFDILNIESISYYRIGSLCQKIPNGIFEGCQSMEQLTMHNSVTEIDDYSLSGCSSLKEITFSHSLTKIGAYAFSYCSSLKTIEIPSSVTKIEGYAFLDCSSLEQLKLPSSITRIERSAFSGCSSLKYVIIPSYVSFIGSYAFNRCISLEKIKIQNSVIEMGSFIFNECSS